MTSPTAWPVPSATRSIIWVCTLGDRLLRFGLNLAIGCAVAPRPRRWDSAVAPVSVVAAIATALAAFLVDWSWTFAISLLQSFWLEDTMGIHLLYRRCVMLLGGLFLPLEAYPDWLGNPSPGVFPSSTCCTIRGASSCSQRRGLPVLGGVVLRQLFLLLAGLGVMLCDLPSRPAPPGARREVEGMRPALGPV